MDDRLVRRAGGTAGFLTRRRFRAVLGLLAVVLLLTIVAAASVGPVRVDLASALFGDSGNADSLILLRTRLPRVLLAAIVGALILAKRKID